MSSKTESEKRRKIAEAQLAENNARLQELEKVKAETTEAYLKLQVLY